MRVATWNIQGYAKSKESALQFLLAPADVLCLSEELSKVRNLKASFRVYQVCKRQSRGRYRRGEGVDMVLPTLIPSRLVTCLSTERFLFYISRHSVWCRCCRFVPGTRLQLRCSDTEFQMSSRFA